MFHMVLFGMVVDLQDCMRVLIPIDLHLTHDCLLRLVNAQLGLWFGCSALLLLDYLALYSLLDPYQRCCHLVAKDPS